MTLTIIYKHKRNPYQSVAEVAGIFPEKLKMSSLVLPKFYHVKNIKLDFFHETFSDFSSLEKVHSFNIYLLSTYTRHCARLFWHKTT